jgi:MFS family permease
MTKSSAFTVLAHRDFRYYLAARFLSTFAMMMVGVAVGWQVYDLTKDPMALGIVGLVQFVPAFLLTLPGGLASDRFDRRRVLLFGFSMEFIVALTLLIVTLSENPPIGVIFGILVLVGVGRAFLSPASQSLVPFLVPQGDFPRAVAWASSVFQGACIAGPAVGGLLYALGPDWVYGTATVLIFASSLMILSLRTKLVVHNPSATGLRALFTGVHFVFERKMILGAVSLDLFAVLFGGATALLPVFASDMLHTGPWGLGLLRSAPAVGAGIMALVLAHHPIHEKAGKRLFTCVALFGLFTIAFGLSRSFWVSLLVLGGLGAVDMVSVVVRQTLVQMATPDEMRGRVSAVNMLFIGASNELGEFESGVTAAWFGPVPAVILGGLGTLAVVGLWSWWFPSLRKMDRLDSNNA